MRRFRASDKLGRFARSKASQSRADVFRDQLHEVKCRFEIQGRVGHSHQHAGNLAVDKNRHDRHVARIHAPVEVGEKRVVCRV